MEESFIERVQEALKMDPEGVAQDAANGINPEANPLTIYLRVIFRRNGTTPREPVKILGCDYPGRFDREDNSRCLGWGPAPGKGSCDYPRECPGYGKEEMDCPLAKI